MKLLAVGLAALALLPGSVALGGTSTLWASSDAELAAAVWKLRASGGTIRLAPRAYRQLYVPARSSRPLRIVGTRGARLERVLFDGTQRVTLAGVAIRPRSGDALVEVRDSRHVELDRVLVSAQGTRYSASVLLSSARNVRIRRSTFTHCGDRSRVFVNCVLLYRWSHHIVIEDSWFHDCLGCDFVHGRFGSDLAIRRNRFERELPCSIGSVCCGHQD